jgi:hypothetical protein
MKEGAMAATHDIREGMQVLGSDGGMVGRVTGLHGDHIQVEPDPHEAGTSAYVVPSGWIRRVDDHVHLDREAALVRDTWQSAAGHGSDAPAGREAAHDPPARGSKWVWILGALLLLLVLYLGLRGCDYAGREPDYENSANGTVDSPDT